VIKIKKSISRIKKKYPNVYVETIERAFIDSYGKQNNLSFEQTTEIKRFLREKAGLICQFQAIL